MRIDKRKEITSKIFSFLNIQTLHHTGTSTMLDSSFFPPCSLLTGLLLVPSLPCGSGLVVLARARNQHVWSRDCGFGHVVSVISSCSWSQVGASFYICKGGESYSIFRVKNLFSFCSSLCNKLLNNIISILI